MNEKTMVVLQGIISDLKKGTPTPSVSEISQNAAGVTNTGSTWDNFIQLLGLVFLLILILFATYYTTRFVGKVKLGQMKNSNFQVIDTYRISQNKVMQIIKIANKYIVVAIGKDTIQYITELDEEQVMVRDPDSREKQNFKQTFEKLRNINK